MSAKDNEFVELVDGRGFEVSGNTDMPPVGRSIGPSIISIFVTPAGPTSLSLMPYKPTATLSGHTDSVRVLRFSPCGDYLATGGDDGLILVFSTYSWKMIAKVVNVSPVTALLWHSAFPKTLMCGFHSGAVVTICLDSGDWV